jgi:hypothetical protein
MLLSNPKQQRTLAEIVADLPDAIKSEAATRIARVNRLLTRRNQQDSDLLDSLMRILKSPNPQAQRLRELIKGIATNA